MPRAGRLYVMQVEGSRRKVGFSTQPARRAKELRGLQIEFVSGWRDDISNLEKMVHAALTLQGRHVAGEVFDAELDVIVEAINTVLGGVTFHVAPDQKTATQTKKLISLALDPKLLERLEKWRTAQDVPPSKTAVHETALREFLERREKGGRKQ